MAETATYISELVPGNVDSNADPTDGGAQLRVIKDTLTNTLANFDAAITADAADVNRLDITTEGTAQASKVLTADSSADIDASAITWTDLGTVTTVDINGGTIDGVTITTSSGTQTGGTIDGTALGGTTPAAGSFTTLDATGAVDFDSGTIDGVTIGGASAAAGTFTTITTSGAATLNSGTVGGANIASETYVDTRARVVVSGTIADVSTAETVWIPVPIAGDITRLDTVLEGAITVADATVTLQTAASATIGSVVVAFSGSAAGDVDTDSSLANNAVTAGTAVKIATDGGSTTAARLQFAITIDNS